MIEWKKLITTLIGLALIAMMGFFVDFQIFKQRVQAVERRTAKIDEIKDLNCEIALYIFKSENKKVLRYCR